MKILITPRGFANYGIEQIRLMEAKGMTVHYNDTGKAYTPAEFKKLAADAAGIIVGVDQMDRALIDSCPQLKVICKFGVGTDNIDVAYAKEKGIQVERTVGSNSRAVAEHVIALMFCDAKNLATSIQTVKEGEWEKPTGQELHEKILGIIGFGAIGKYLAAYAKGIGMTVYAYDSFDIPSDVAAEYGVVKKTFTEIITEADYLSLHVPLVRETENLISAKELHQMKATACLINTARGGIVDEQALEMALTEKEIRSACFDVYSTEPPTAADSLVQMRQFLLTPHTAARTAESEKRTCELSTQMIIEKLATA